MNRRTSSSMRLLAAAMLVSACLERPRVGPRVDASSACGDAPASALEQLWLEHLSASAPTGCATMACHGGGAGGLAFGTARELRERTVGLPSAGDPGMLRVAPGDPLSSFLYVKLLPGASGRMPVGGPYLDEAALAAVRGWICSGAPESENPLPSVEWIAPSTVTAGSGPLALTLRGAGFLATSTARVDGSPRPTVVRSGTEITAELLASDLGVVGTRTITVSNPAPGGGTSGALTLTVAESLPDNPAPVISAITPSTVLAGDPELVLTIEGSGLLWSSEVRVDGSPRVTRYLGDGSRLAAELLASDAAEAGARIVTVRNPEPGGGTSAGVTLAVDNPRPSITAISPSTVAAGTGSVALTVEGTGFVGGSTVHLDGSARTTVVESRSRLTAQLLASDVAAALDRTVTVVSPAPGGGTSGGATLTVTSQPHVVSLSPCGAVAGRDVSVTVEGFNFAPGAAATVDGRPVPVTYVSATRLTLAIPAAHVPSAPPSNLVPVVVTDPASGSSSAAQLGIASRASTLSGDVQRIFDASCTSCHKSAGGSAPLDLDPASAYADLVGAPSSAAQCAPRLRVLACGPLRSQSVLVDKILAGTAEPACSGTRMPKSAALPPDAVRAIVDWIAQGAPP